MVKIRSVEALDQEIDSAIAWRKQELTTALQITQQSRGPARKANLRSSLLLLYAHWEGWIKEVARLYVRYVNTLSLPHLSLSDPFLGHALKVKLGAVGGTSAPLMHAEFATFIRNDLSTGASFSESLVRTESNLSSTVLFDIVDRLGLERRPQYSLRANMIDVELVKRRNTIAHGEYLSLSLDEFKVLRQDVLGLLELFTDDVRNAASTGRHLARPSPQV